VTWNQSLVYSKPGVIKAKPADEKKSPVAFCREGRSPSTSLRQVRSKKATERLRIKMSFPAVCNCRQSFFANAGSGRAHGALRVQSSPC